MMKTPAARTTAPDFVGNVGATMISAGCARTVTGARSMKNGEVGTDMHEKIARLLEREGTGISWCDLTLNPWIGCTKVSPACDHCYAEEDRKSTRLNSSH